MDMLGSIVSYPAEGVMNYVKRHGAYVIRYENKVQDLDEQNRLLRDKKERIQDMVNTATNNGKVIITEVNSWLEKVAEMEGKIANILPLPENRESFKCFKACMCPNIMWRHKMGKDAVKLTSEVSELIRRGEVLQSSPVARDAPFQAESQFDSSPYYTVFHSRASVFSDVMNALKDSGVDMIGVHGPGGAGKTTMVKEVAKEAKKQGIFDEIVIAVVSNDPNISKLQDDIAAQLLLKYDQTTELGRADELRKALLNKKRKILVILDDLWHDPNLKAIGIPISGTGDKGCKIMLTSRKEEVLKYINVGRSIFPINYLEELEAWDLFKKVTGYTGCFGVDELTAKEICKKCANLPIAIVAVGAALKERGVVEWQNALYELNKSRLKYIEGVEHMDYTPLKLSYDFLKDEGAKSCFLLCCLFPEDAEISIDDLVIYSLALGFLGTEVNTLESAKIKVQTMVNKLKRSCLLLNGARENFVKMHDLIRDLAIFITKKKQVEHSGGQDWPRQQQFMVDHNFQKWPENDAWKHHTAISLRINDKFSFPCGVLHCPLMHTLVLKAKGWSWLKIPNDFIEGGKGAIVLDFENISLDFRSLVFELNDLRMLRLKCCKLLGELSTIRYLKNLKILSFVDIEIKKLPEEIGELTHLQVLDLRCWQLEVIPKGVISKLRNLEELYVGGGLMKWDTDTTVDGGEISNASISELKSLDKLTSLHVRTSAKSFKIMAEECLGLFTRLSKFSIFINIWGSVGAPNVLKIDGRDGTGKGLCPLIEKVDPLMEKVHDLSLKYFSDLRYLEYYTSSGGRSFRKLINLSISKCHSMKYIFSPSCARELQQLQRLEVRDCRELEQIIGVADNYHGEEVVTDETIIFTQLKILDLHKLPRFRSFGPKIERNPSNWTTTAEFIFNEKVSFPSLEDLTIEELPVKHIWNKQMIQSPNRSNNVSFSQLKGVDIYKCENLINVFPSNMLLQLQNLEILWVDQCNSLTLVVEGLNLNSESRTMKSSYSGVFPKLRSLELKSSYSGVFPMLRSLEFLDEDSCYDDSSDK